MRFVLCLIACVAVSVATPACKRKKDSAAASSLEAVPYFGSAPAEDEREGTVRYDRERAFRGLNLMVSTDGRGAVLFDMEGKVVHRWNAPSFASVFHTVEIDANGCLGAAYGFAFANGFDLDSRSLPKSKGLLILDWQSSVIWRRSGSYSHEVTFLDDGSLLAIRDHFRVEDIDGTPSVLNDDVIEHISSTDRVLQSISTYDTFTTGIDRAALQAARGNQERDEWGVADVIHANAVVALDRDIPGLGAAGSWLISMRKLDLVAVIDPKTRERTWEFGPGVLGRQHQPGITPEGTVVIFDNLGLDGASRVVEVDPRTKQIIWQYPREKDEAFYSELRGGAQRLPNGNTLVVISDRGRAVEVTKDGQVVWEYLTPIRPHDPTMRMAPYRIERLTPEFAARLPFTLEELAALREGGYAAAADPE